MSKITVGILSLSAETIDNLRLQIEGTGLASVRAEADEYCAAKSDRSTRRFIEARPEVILVDMAEKDAALQALHILHSVLPDAWIFVSSDNDNTEIVIESMRAGAREFLPKPVTNRALQQAFGRYVADTQKRIHPASTGKMYCIASAKCGAGATSVAINTAAALALSGEVRVGLLDMNTPVGDIAAYLNLKPKFTVADAFAAAPRLDSALLDSYTQSVAGFSLLAGVNEYRPGKIAPTEEFARVLEVAAETYTHCFFDFPLTSHPEHLRFAADISTAVLLVVTPDVPAIWRADRLIRFLAETDCLEKTRIVLNRSSNSDEIGDKEIEKAIGHPIFFALPNDYSASSLSINKGKPVHDIDNSELARGYRELAERLTGIALPGKRRGLLKMFL